VVCQTPLFSAYMISQSKFSAATMFQLAATMYEGDTSTLVSVMKTVLEPKLVTDKN